MEWSGTYFYLLGTFSALLYFYLFFRLNRKSYFIHGFFVGILLFYWISLSFRFYDLPYLIPFIVVFIGLVYGGLFGVLFGFIAEKFGEYKNHIQTVFILLFSYIHPFGFDWFRFEILLVNSYFGVDKLPFLAILVSVLLFTEKNRYIKLLSILPLFLALHTEKNTQEVAKDIYLHQSHITQDKKWEFKYLADYIEQNFETIDKNIGKNRVVVLPESAFPMLLNEESLLVDELLELSKDITIITGALRSDERGSFNSAFIFSDGGIEIVDKTVLVPFGEKNPLPKFMSDFVNDIFFDGAEDYQVAERPTDIKIGDRIFRIAICYEATSEEFLRNAPKDIITISNNGWFYPSLEPYLQKLIMRYHSKKDGVTFYHSTNMSKAEVVRY